MEETIKMIIGSYGSYNEGNEKSLGSNELDLENYETWEEIENELKKQNFNLDGIDQELFIQDLDNLDISNYDLKNLSPRTLFETLKESGVLDNEYQHKVLNSYLEIESFQYFKDLVDRYGSNWDQDIVLYDNQDLSDVAYNLFNDMYEIPEYLESYIDYERFERELEIDNFYETTNGVLEIR